MSQRFDRLYLKQFKKLLLTMTVVLIIFPVFLLSLRSIAYGWRWGEIIPSSFNLRGWSILVQEPRLVVALTTTLLIGTAVVILNLLIALPAGKALAHYSFKGKSFLETVLLMPILVPSLAVAMGIHLTMIRIGLADSWWGVVLVHLIPTVPYSIRILRAGYEQLGIKWLEQAQTLGASSWLIFRTITFPLLLISIRTTIFLVFLISLSQYILTIFIGGGNVVTLAIIYYPYFHTVDDAVIASFSLLFAIIPLFFLVAVELLLRFLNPFSKVTKGGLKI